LVRGEQAEIRTARPEVLKPRDAADPGFKTLTDSVEEVRQGGVITGFRHTGPRRMNFAKFV
jgi:hypothetical protein